MAKRKKSKGHKGRSGFSLNFRGLNIAEAGFSFGYGFVRPYAVNNATVQSALSKMPGGAYADNILLGGISGAVIVLFKPTGLIRDGLQTIVNSESFLAGMKASTGVTMAVSSTSSGTTVYL